MQAVTSDAIVQGAESRQKYVTDQTNNGNDPANKDVRGTARVAPTCKFRHPEPPKGDNGQEQGGTGTRKTNVPGTTPGVGAPARHRRRRRRPARAAARAAGARRRPGPRARAPVRPAAATLYNSLHCV